MYELSANVEWLFTEAGPECADRVRLAADGGFHAVEIWTWRDKKLPAIRSALRETGTQLQTICVDPMGELTDSRSHGVFLAGLRDSILVAEDLGSPFLVITAEGQPTDVAPEDQRAAIVDALRRAADLLAGRDVVLLLENLNSRVDHLGTFLDTSRATIQVLREVGSPAVRMLYDAYHSLVMDEDPSNELADSIDLVSHVQIADVPGRGEPGSGQIDWLGQLSALRQLGYDSMIGLEYQPTGETAQSVRTIVEIAARA